MIAAIGGADAAYQRKDAAGGVILGLGLERLGVLRHVVGQGAPADADALACAVAEAVAVRLHGERVVRLLLALLVLDQKHLLDAKTVSELLGHQLSGVLCVVDRDGHDPTLARLLEKDADERSRDAEHLGDLSLVHVLLVVHLGDVHETFDATIIR